MSQFEHARQCTFCKDILPLPPNPVIQGNGHSPLCIIGQAPGIAAHNTNTPWNDPSGDRLRLWLGTDKESFYDKNLVAILPMSFCYPGKAKGGDMPPIKACAPKWHKPLLDEAKPKLTLLIGKHAQDYYLSDKQPLTQRVKDWRQYLPNYVVLPHPSPRNNIWLKKNAWFERDILPQLRSYIKTQIAGL